MRVDVLMENGEICESGIPNDPENVGVRGVTVIEDHTIVICGGMKTNNHGNDKCWTMDLRKPKDEWSWEQDIPVLPMKLSNFLMEYVKHTKKIYVIGGKDGSTLYKHVSRIFYSMQFFKIQLISKGPFWCHHLDQCNI